MTGRGTIQSLRGALDRLRAASPAVEGVVRDPVRFPRRYRDPADRELAAWIAAALAYGRVAAFGPKIEAVLDLLGERPRRGLEGIPPARLRRGLRNWVYRFNRGEDLAVFLAVTRNLLRRFGSLEAAFLDGDAGGPIREPLARFAARFRGPEAARRFPDGRLPYGYRYLVADPASGSAAKRLNLFLRWVVRPDDGVDLGLWTNVDPARLEMPLDAHVIRIGRLLGLTRRRTPDAIMAGEITEALRRLAPDDPTRYDFAICHLGISGGCPVRADPARCLACPLRGDCRRGRRAVRDYSSKCSRKAG